LLREPSAAVLINQSVKDGGPSTLNGIKLNNKKIYQMFIKIIVDYYYLNYKLLLKLLIKNN